MVRSSTTIVSQQPCETDDSETSQAHIDELRRHIAAVSHSLRQPLQTMGLLHGVLAAKVRDPEALKIVRKLEEALGSVTDMLNSIAAQEQAETQTTYPEYVRVPVLEERLDEESDNEAAFASKIFIVDDSPEVREGMGALLRSLGYTVALFGSAEEYLAARPADSEGILLIDALLPGMSGLDLLKCLRESGGQMPAVMITGSGDVALAVQAMKAGAADFLEKPVSHKELSSIVEGVLRETPDPRELAERDEARQRLAGLSGRERQVMDMILEGHPNKNIAADLGISQRTVEAHRASIMKKLGVRSLPALLKLTLSAGVTPHS